MYPALLANVTRVGEWVVLSRGNRSRGGPSALRKRYPSHDFRSQEEPGGTFTIEARPLGDLPDCDFCGGDGIIGGPPDRYAECPACTDEPYRPYDMKDDRE